MRVERVRIPVDGRAPGGQTNAYLVEGVVIDPAARTRDLDERVDRRGIEHVVATHTHPDHVGGLDEYADRATVWAHDRYVDGFEAATGVEPDRTFRGGDAVGPLDVIETPGHARDHVAFRAGNEAVVGDLAIAEGSVFVGGPGSDLRAYLTSLRRLYVRDLDRLHPGHGPPVEEPGETIERLLRRRLGRERRVREAVEDGARTPAEIVERAYDRDPEHLDLARLAVEAHLDKLAVEGDLEWDGRRARPA